MKGDKMTKSETKVSALEEAPVKMRIMPGGVVEGLDFRYSERALFVAWALKPENAKIVSRMRSGDCLLFISRSRKHGAFIPAAVAKQSVADVACGSFLSMTFSCPHGFSWMMLGEYARELGVELEGVKSFREHLKKMVDHVVSDLWVKPVHELEMEYRQAFDFEERVKKFAEVKASVKNDLDVALDEKTKVREAAMEVVGAKPKRFRLKKVVLAPARPRNRP